MPDKRSHRGRHPEDRDAFAADKLGRLRDAVGDLSWLLGRGYAAPSALKIVGDRYSLLERQRTAVMRCACSDEALISRRERQAHESDLQRRDLHIDGYNVLTTIEAALAGGVIIVGRDGSCRDMASMHGTFRRVNETVPAIRLLGSVLCEQGVKRAVWYLDRPVSNSGRLKDAILEIAAEHRWDWEVQVVADPDAVLSTCSDIVATADSAVLDRCRVWVNLARIILERRLPDAWVADLRQVL